MIALLVLTQVRDKMPVAVSVEQIAALVTEPELNRALEPTGESKSTSIVLTGSGAMIEVTESIADIFEKVKAINEHLAL